MAAYTSTSPVAVAGEPLQPGKAGVRGCADTSQEEADMAVVKIIELVGSSKQGSDDAVKQALAEAQKTLRNISGVDVVSVGLRGDNLDEWRAQVRIGFLVESVD
jgi:flavin-binding protein dodecin